jgi:hypothetical protein
VLRQTSEADLGSEISYWELKMEKRERGEVHFKEGRELKGEIGEDASPEKSLVE